MRTVACNICGIQTINDDTQICDGCWEMKHRMDVLVMECPKEAYYFFSLYKQTALDWWLPELKTVFQLIDNEMLATAKEALARMQKQVQGATVPELTHAEALIKFMEDEVHE